MAILKVKKLTEVETPTQGTKGAAGIDCYMPKTVIVPAGARGQFVGLGISVEVPDGYHVQVLPRSSTGLKTPIRIANMVGIVDSDFRGQVAALVDNVSDEDFTLEKGNRYFQLVVTKNCCDNVLVVDELSQTERGASGYGSTGK